jgi:hypothetical protein
MAEVKAGLKSDKDVVKEAVHHASKKVSKKLDESEIMADALDSLKKK